MADLKISQLNAITVLTPATDVLPVVDSGGVTKKITTNQILGSGGTATLASATITGALTVDTTTLVVDPTNDRVGIGTATPAAKLIVRDGSNRNLLVSSDATQLGSAGIAIGSFTDNAAGYAPLSIIAGTSMAFGMNGSTAMTLNSTGLGVGVVPSVAGENIYVRKDQAAYTSIIVRNDNTLASGTGCGFTLIDGGVNAGWFRRQRDGSGNTDIGYKDSLRFRGAITGTERTDMTIDTSGNVGIGVTPSAWGGSNRAALQFPGGNAIQGSAAIGLASFNNCFNNGTNDICIANGTTYKHVVGTGYQWFIGTGTAGNSFSFGDAKMTLDASGRLLIGTTDAGSNSGIGLKAAYSATAPYFSTVGSSTSASEYSYLLYSTGGTPAFKFYVSYSGQISATSGTVAALSDARFKENIQDIDVGLGAILALKPRKFDWKAGKGKDIKGDRGFIAQEFETVFPNLIDEWADPAPEGEAPYKSVRQDLIPVLVKAIQELTARVQTLEAK